VRPALRAWLVSRAAVLALMALATYLQVRHGYGRAPERGSDTAFYAWDADWYRRIAAYGYQVTDALRFFPLVALPGRLLSPLGSWVAGASVVLVANASALAYAIGLSRLTLRELRDERAAAFVPWLALVNPVSYVLVIGYAEATFAALAVWCFLGLRRGAWLPAAGAAFLAGLTRPTGVLLALPALVEAWRAPHRDLPARALAVLAAPVGCAAYLAWVWAARGDPLLPFEAQQADDLRGGVLAWPGSAPPLRLVWVPVVLGLLVLVARRLPASYTAFSAASVLLALGTPGLASFERYAVAAFPLLMVAALARPRSVRIVTFVVCCSALSGYAVIAFAHRYVP
jgi:hypothetical protein